MTIASIRTFPLRIPYEVGGPKQEFLGHPRTHLEALFLRVETHEGVVGWGECFGINMWPLVRTALDDFIAPYATGKDEDAREALLSDLKRRLHVYGRTGPVMYALSGLEIALWDIAGRKAEKPLHALLGGARRDSLEAYASLMRYSTAEPLARNCERALALGYRSVKIHETTLAQCQAAREALGQAGLMIDTNCAWSLAQAIELLPALEKLAPAWLEEPTWPPEDATQHARLKARTAIPLTAGENAATPYELQGLASGGALAIVQPSVTKIGGISDLVAAVRGLPTGVRAIPHSPYFGPGLIATLHIAAAMQEETPVERLFCDFAAHPLGEAIEAPGGRFALPQGPGLGVEPDMRLMAEFAA